MGDELRVSKSSLAAAVSLLCDVRTWLRQSTEQMGECQHRRDDRRCDRNPGNDGLASHCIPVALDDFHLWPAIAYLLLSTIFTFGLNPVGGHYVHEHYLFERNQETYSYYGPINSVSFNVGYHNEHHDFFGIPGSRLPELKRMAPEYYDNLKSHRSWIGVLLDFITNERLGHFSRITRTWRTYEVASGRKPGDRQPIEATESIES
jgi:hypothetical protein